MPRQLRDAGEPVFAEPWQAQAFAAAVKLSESGWFTWVEWAAALAEEIKAAEAADAKAGRAPDDGTRYYEHWLSALEKLVAAKGLAEKAAIQLRKEEWAEAYRHTPARRAARRPGSAATAGREPRMKACSRNRNDLFRHLSSGRSDREKSLCVFRSHEFTI